MLRQRVLSEREVAVVRMVRDHRHVIAPQVRSLLFPDTSRTPCDRALTRLTNDGYIYRSKQFAPVAGAGHYVYRLDRRGHEMFSDERFKPYRHNVNHSLAVGESVVSLHGLERAGALELVGIDYEPDCHTMVGGAHLKPDLYVHMNHARHGSWRLWLEVDLATEGPARIHSKLRLYRQARQRYSDADRERWPMLPRVLWVAIDKERERRLNLLISEIPEGDQKMFRVTTFEELPAILA